MRVQRTPNQYIQEVLGEEGQSLAALLRNLGLWTQDYHSTPTASKAFNANVANLDDTELGNTYGYWAGESIRIGEIYGYLKGHLAYLGTQLKIEQARARQAVREDEAKAAANESRAPKKMPAAEVNDLAILKPDLQAAQNQYDSVQGLFYSVEQAKEYSEVARSTLSREITRRGDLSRIISNR